MIGKVKRQSKGRNVGEKLVGGCGRGELARRFAKERKNGQLGTTRNFRSQKNSAEKQGVKGVCCIGSGDKVGWFSEGATQESGEREGAKALGWASANMHISYRVSLSRRKPHKKKGIRIMRRNVA